MAKSNQVIFSGDSLTLGNHVSAGQGYVDYVLTALPEITGDDSNIAVGSTTLASDGNQDGIADAAYNAAKQVNILTVLFGANDMLTLSGAAFFAALKTWCQARQAAGFKVIVLTTLNHNTSGGIAAKRNAANALTRADTSFYDALADIASDATIGTDAAPSNTTYFSDGVHPTAAGNAILAPYVTRAIQSLILTSAGRNL